MGGCRVRKHAAPRGHRGVTLDDEERAAAACTPALPCYA